MTTSNVIELNISEKTYSYAKIYASLLKDDFQRKRAYASLVALYALIDAFEKTDNEVQKSMTLFRNPILNEQYEISDIYINNWHIDVRVFVDGDAVLVPKTHFDNNIAPDFYAVVKVDSKLEKAELIGFADVQNVEKEAFDYHYYSIALKSLISYDAFLAKVCNSKQVEFTAEEHEMFKELYLSFMDDEMKPEIKNKLLKHLFNCVQCRTEFCCFTGFEMVSCNMGAYSNLFDDMTLNIVGAQAVDSEKYAGKEQTIYIGPDVETNEVEEANIDVDTVLNDIPPIVEDATPVVEEANVTVQDKVEEAKSEEVQTEEVPLAENEMTVADILDELFSIEEGYIEPEISQEKQPEENNIDEDALEKIVAEKIKEDEAVFEEDEPLDSYEEIPLDDVKPTLVDSEPSIQKEETLEKMEFSDTTPEPLEINEEETLVLNDNVQDIDLNVDAPVVEEVPTLAQDKTINVEEPLVEEYVEEEIPLETDNIKNVSDEMEVFEESLVENLINESEEFSIESETPLFSNEESEELEVLETNEDLEVIEDDVEEQNQEIEITDLQTDDNNSLSSSINEFEDTDLEIHPDLDDEMEILRDSESLVQNATKEAKESIQQVIVDYDEFGEPIYSYITSVAQEAQFITDDAIDDDIMNEVFETYPTEQEDYEVENNDAVSSRPVEYVSNEDEQGFEEWNDDSSKISKQDDEYPEYEEYSDEESEVPESYDEYVDDEEVETSEEDDNGADEVTPLPSIDVNYQDEETEETSVDENEIGSGEDVDDIENSDDEEESLENDEYDEDDVSEDDEEEEDMKKKGSPLLVLLVLLLIVAGSAAGAFFFFKNKNHESNTVIVPENTASTNTLEIPLTVPSEPEQVTDMFGNPEESEVVQETATGDIVASDKGTVEQTSEVKNDAEKLPALPKTEKPQQKTVEAPKTTAKEKVTSSASRSKSLASAFTNGGNRATLRSVNWLCAPQLFTDTVFKAYMQDLDNVLKLNLRKNILDATETPQNNAVTVKMAIDKVGDLSKVLISESSGSKQIDDIVLQSIKESFEGEKSQDLNNSALKQDMYYLKVVIKL